MRRKRWIRLLAFLLCSILLFNSSDTVATTFASKVISTASEMVTEEATTEGSKDTKDTTEEKRDTEGTSTEEEKTTDASTEEKSSVKEEKTSETATTEETEKGAENKSIVIADFVDFDIYGYDPYVTVYVASDKKDTIDSTLLPASMDIKTADGEVVAMPVSWECRDDVLHTEYELYTYDLILPDGYQLSKKLKDASGTGEIGLPFVDCEIFEGDNIYAEMESKYPFSDIRYTWKDMEDEKLDEYFWNNSCSEIYRFLHTLSKSERKLLLTKDTRLTGKTSTWDTKDPEKEVTVSTYDYIYKGMFADNQKANGARAAAYSTLTGHSYYDFCDTTLGYENLYYVTYTISSGTTPATNQSGTFKVSAVEYAGSSMSNAGYFDISISNFTYVSQLRRGKTDTEAYRSDDSTYYTDSDGKKWWRNQYYEIADIRISGITKPAYSYAAGSVANNQTDVRCNWKSYDWKNEGESSIDTSYSTVGVSNALRAQVHIRNMGIYLKNANTNTGTSCAILIYEAIHPTFTVTQYHYYTSDNGSSWTHFNTTSNDVAAGTYFAPYNVSPPSGYGAGNNYGLYNSSGSLGNGTVGVNSFMVTEAGMYVHVHYYKLSNQFSVYFDGNGATSGSTAGQTMEEYVWYNLNANGFKKEYTITFDGNGGTASVGSKVAAANFKGWQDYNSYTYAGVSIPWYAFNCPFYGNAQSDVYAAVGSGYNKKGLIEHWWNYTVNGGEGRQSSPMFCVGWYMAAYADLKNAYGNYGPSYVNHWRDNGYGEGRQGADTTYPTENYYYPDKAKVGNLADVGKTATLTAIWGPNTTTTTTATREGCTLVGWNTKRDGTGTSYGVNASITVTGNTTLYAQWKNNTYTNNIAHWAWGFQNGEGNNGEKNAFQIGSTDFTATFATDFIMDESRAVTIPNGYNLDDSWGTSSLTGSWQKWQMGTDVTQRAFNLYFEYDYSPIKYQITYELDGGTNNADNPDSYTVLYGVSLQEPTKEGYLFVGWTDENGDPVNGINVGEDATFSNAEEMYLKLAQRETGNKVLTANWTYLYDIEYDLTGGAWKLPDEYQAVEYIESTGTQYINTGYKPKEDTRIEISASTEDTTHDMPLFGVRKAYAEDGFLCWFHMLHSETPMPAFGATSNIYTKFGVKAGTKYEISLENGMFICNDKKYPFTKQSFTSSYDLYLFGLNHSDSLDSRLFYGKIYQAKIYENDELVRYYVPCVTKDGEAGLYDLKNEIFYGNDGSGEFIAGDECEYTVKTSYTTLSPTSIDSGLPVEGYTRLTYIESTGTQYINTGYKPNDKTKIEISASTEDTTHDMPLFGVRKAYEEDAFLCWFHMIHSETPMPAFGTTTNIGTKFGVKSGTQYAITLENGSFVSNKNSLSFTKQSFTSSYDLYLFGLNHSDSLDSRLFYGKIYYAKIYEDGELVRNFVPCKNAKGEVGLYDRVNDKFYGNDGTGTFTAGEEVSDPVLTYKLTPAFTLNEPRKENDVFLGWIGSNGSTPEKEVTVEKGSTGDRTYQAVWKFGKYKIIYNLGEGEENHPDNPEEYTPGIGIAQFYDPTKPGHEFKGWYEDAALTIPISYISTERTGDVTLYPKWSELLIVVYNGNEAESGTLQSEVVSELDDPTYEIKQNEGFTDYEKDSAAFSGWDKYDYKTPADAYFPEKNLPQEVTFDELRELAQDSVDVEQYRSGIRRSVTNSLALAGSATVNGVEDVSVVNLYAVWDNAPYLEADDVLEFYEGEYVTKEMLVENLEVSDNEDDRNGDPLTKEDIRIVSVRYQDGKLKDGVDPKGHDETWEQDVPEDFTLHTWFLEIEPPEEEKERYITYEVVYAVTDSAGNETQLPWTVKIKYNEVPVINGENRYFTLEEAQEGKITLEELLIRARAWDKEDCGTHCPDGSLSSGNTCLEKEEVCKFGERISLLGFRADKFTSYKDSGYEVLSYHVIDQYGKESVLQFTVYVVKDGMIVEPDDPKMVRFINKKYYDLNLGVLETLPEDDPDTPDVDERKEAIKAFDQKKNGGLYVASYWYTKESYRTLIQRVLSENAPAQETWVIPASDRALVKDYILEHGVGNYNNGLDEFYQTFKKYIQ